MANQYINVYMNNPTAGGEFTDSITFEESITAVNTLFYVKASSADTKNPQTDRSISINVNAVIASVG